MSRRRSLLVRWTGLGFAIVAAAAIVVLILDNEPDPAAPTGEHGAIDGLTSVLARDSDEHASASFAFEEVSTAAGISFRHFPATRASLLPEDMGSGLAWGDYDDDGDPDLFVVNWAPGRQQLYRNEADGSFTEVTARAGLDAVGFGMGAAWADYDGDGDLDLYVTRYGANTLYRNEGDGTFVEVARAAGVAGDRFSAGAAWQDFDRDGDLDLYVTSYVDFEFDESDRGRLFSQGGTEVPFTLNPSAYQAAPNQLYRNEGDGRFEDVADIAGVSDPDGRSLSAAWVDLDDDGWPDLYVANDVSRNGVFRNLGDGLFEDVGPSSLAADYRGAMGIATGDIDGDGDADLFVTHWIAQENALFRNMLAHDTHDQGTDHGGTGRLFFTDVADELGLGQVSIDMSGWATSFADLDNDADVDLWVVNGSTLERRDDPTELVAQQLFLFRNEPGAGFFEVARRSSIRLAQPFVGRGGGHADYDGDGRLDLAVLVHRGELLLLRNRSPGEHHWLRVQLRQKDANTRAIGARVTVRVGATEQVRVVGSGGAYLSQNELTLHFGLGPAERVETLTIRWPDGQVETHNDVTANQVLTYLRE